MINHHSNAPLGYAPKDSPLNTRRCTRTSWIFSRGEAVIRLKKRKFLSFVAGVFVVVGLFNPWLWRGYDPWLEFNPHTKTFETHYRLVTSMSPFYTSIVGDGEPETRIWLVDLETTLAGLMLIASAAFSFLKFGKKWIYLVLSLISFAACLLFFLSLGGRGLGLGSQTQLGWGSTSTLMGITIMFFSSLAELISETAV